jgi:hypothetical protein
MTRHEMAERREKIVRLWRAGYGVKLLAYDFQLAVRSVQRMVEGQLKPEER